jgi:gliding motility-associated-like protein
LRSVRIETCSAAMKLRLLAFSLIFLTSSILFGQDFSNKGKDFWVGYGSHVSMYSGANSLNPNGGSQNLVLYFTSDQTANVTVTIPATGWTRNYVVSPNTVTESASIPKTDTDDARLGIEGVSNKGIHITSDKPIVAYAHIYDGAISGATLLFPTNTLGQDYYTLGFTQISNQAYSYPFAYVIATEDNTLVEVTLPVATQTHTAGVFTQLLQKGQVLNLMGQITGNNGVDLTGTRIRTISSGGSGCKRIAVFCGTGKIYINCSASQTSSADNIIQQCFPSNAWGKKYIAIPTKDMPNNFFRVMVSDPATVVKLNGVPMTGLVGGRYYQFQSNTTNIVEADKPVMVAEFITTRASCNNNTFPNDGDPEMIYLSPVEQTIKKITLNSTSHANIVRHYINVVMRTTGITSFKLDGVNKASSFATLPGDPTYSYVQFTTTAGIHNLDCDSGFNAIAYGYGNAESYGYNAGANVIDLYQYVTLQNQYATVNFPATCKGTPFKFSITLPYQPIKLKWDFSQNPNLSPNDSVVVNPPVGQTVIPADSSFIKDGKTLYVYKVSQTYTFSAVGTYSVKVFANNPTTDGCSGEQEISYDVVVYEKPVADWAVSSTGCTTNPVQFSDATNANGRTVASWDWDFGDGTTSTLKDPPKNYTAGNTYNVRLTAITDIGCISDTSKPFTISAPPIAKFGVDSPRCAESVLTFTDSSTIPAGTMVKWYWDFGNGNTLVNTTNGPVTQSYPMAGSYAATLQVESSTGCKSIVYQYPLVIGPYPNPDFTVPNVVCLPDGDAQFTNTSTISNGTQSQFTYQWQFSGGGTSTVKDPLHHYSTTGPFSVKLVVTSNVGCVKEVTKAFDNVYARPHADFTAPAESCLRDSTPFQSTSTAAGQSIAQWRWTFGDGGTDTTANPKHLYATAGTYPVKLYVYSDKGCISDTMPGSVTVNPLPTAALSNTTPACETKQISFTDQSTPNVGTLSNWYINYGDGNTGVSGAPFIHTYAAAGSYTVRLAVQNSKGCKSDTLPYPITIHSQPKANYILPEVCLNDSYAQFLDSSYIGDGTDSSFIYSWNFGDPNANITRPNTSTIKNPTHKYTALGNYTATLKVTSTHGCVDSIPRTFIVNGSFPVAGFEVQNGSSLCSNLPVAIKNKSTVSPGNITRVEIYWDYANNPAQKDVDDVPNFDKIYTHKYPDFQQPLTKTYQVRFVAYSGASCTDVTTQAITINSSPKTQFITIPGICFDAAPGMITQGSETGGVPKALDDYSGTPAVLSNGRFYPAIAGPGTFTLKYLFISTAGCRDSSFSAITVWPSPVAKFGVSSPLCEKNAVTFNDSSVANFSNLKTWDWNFGDGNSSTKTTGAPFTYTYTSATNYSATLKVTTDSGCVSNITLNNLLINPLPVVGFIIPSICLPDGRGTFTDTSKLNGAPALFSHLWNFGDPFDPNPSTLPNPTHKYSAVGPYPVKLKITTQAGCVDSTTQTINTIYPQPHADFTVSPAAVCLGAPLTFSDISDGNGGTVNQWNWNFDDGSAIVTTQNPTKTYTSDSTYDVSLFVYNDRGCVSDTMVKAVAVYPFPVVNAGPDLFVLQGGSIILDPIVSGNDLHFKWTDNSLGYLDDDTLLRPKFTPGDDITYRLTVTARGGCQAFDEVFIKVLKQPVVPNAFSPNKDGINDTWNIQYLESYPGCTLEVYDRYGQKVFFSEGYRKPWDGSYKGKALPVGVYYYIINPKNGRKLMTGSLTILR